MSINRHLDYHFLYKITNDWTSIHYTYIVSSKNNICTKIRTGTCVAPFQLALRKEEELGILYLRYKFYSRLSSHHGEVMLPSGLK